VASIVIYQLWKLINEKKEGLGRRFYFVVVLFTVLVGFMGTGRHLYRENALTTHKKMMAERTAAHWEAVEKAKNNNLMPAAETQTALSPGEQLFQTNCAVCHAVDQRLVGPPLTEIVPIYENKIDALKQWIKDPGRKREDYPPMTGFPNLSDQQLTNIGNYLLNKNWQ
jgi:cytochrome c